MLIILQIWERSVIPSKYGVLSLVSLNEWSVSVIYPKENYKNLYAVYHYMHFGPFTLKIHWLSP